MSKNESDKDKEKDEIEEELDELNDEDIDAPIEEYDQTDVEPSVDRPKSNLLREEEQVIQELYDRVHDLEGAELQDRLFELVNTVDLSYFEMGGILWKIQNFEYFKEYTDENGNAFDTWEEYVEQKIPYGKRKVRYLVSIWQKFRVDLGLEADDIAGIEWTKLKELPPVIEEDNKDEMLEMARNKSRRELKKEIRELKNDGDQETTNRITFQVYEPQEETIREALELASEMADSEKEGHLLDLICGHFLANHIRDLDKQLEFFIKRLENVFGVRIWYDDQS